MSQQLALNCLLQGREGNTLHLLLEASCAQMLTNNTEERLRSALEVYYGEPLKLRITIGQPVAATPASLQVQRQSERQQAASEVIARDPNVQALCDTFDGQIRPDSTVPTD